MRGNPIPANLGIAGIHPNQTTQAVGPRSRSATHPKGTAHPWSFWTGEFDRKKGVAVALYDFPGEYAMRFDGIDRGKEARGRGVSGIPVSLLQPSQRAATGAYQPVAPVVPYRGRCTLVLGGLTPESRSAGELLYVWCLAAKVPGSMVKDLTLIVFPPQTANYLTYQLKYCAVQDISSSGAAEAPTRPISTLAYPTSGHGTGIVPGALPLAFRPRSEGGTGIESITLVVERIERVQ